MKSITINNNANNGMRITLWKIVLSKNKQISVIEDIISSFSNDFMFKEFYYLDKVSSTQDFALEITKNKGECFSPIVVISDIQTCGKGRKGKYWSSTEGGIWLSLVLETKLEPEKLFLFMMISALGVCETIEKETGLLPVIKWPNDIYINKRKTAGILLDINTESGRIKDIVIGIGVNSNNELSHVVDDLAANSCEQKPVTTLKKELKQEILNPRFIGSLLLRMNHYLGKMDNRLFVESNIQNNYRKRILKSNEHIAYAFKIGDNEFDGKIVDVAADGSILVKSQLTGKTLRISSVNEVS